MRQKELKKYLAIFSCSSLLLLMLSSCNNTNPTFYVKHSQIHIGSILVRTAKKVDFSIYNHGDKTLLILDYSANCECTVINLKKGTKIAPHDSLKLTVKIIPNILERNKQKFVLATFKTNSDQTFHRVYFDYYVKD